jgi:PAS domain S-box-containing protein
MSPATSIDEAARYLKIERDLAMALGRARSLSPALEAILDAALLLGEIDGGGVYVFDDAGNLSLTVYRGLGADFVDTNRFVAADDPRVAMVRAGTPIFSTASQMRSRRPEAMAAEGLHALGVVPVRDGDETVAVLNVASHTVDEITAPVADALVAIASRIGGVLERVRAEAAVRSSQQNFQALFDSLDDFLWVLDERGCIVHTNSVVQSRLGYTREELEGRNVTDVHPADRREEAVRIVGEMLRGVATHCPIPLVHKDGHHIPVETVVSQGSWNGQAAILGISRDITRRQRAEAALFASERTHRAIVEHAPVGIARLDLSGRWVQANAALERMTGYVADELYRLDFVQITHPDDQAASIERFRALVAGASDAYHLEKRYMRRAGTILWADVSVSLVRTLDGKPDFVVAMVNDVTARKELEAAQAEVERQFRLMADAAPVLIWVSDVAGRYTFFNRTWHAFTGRTSLESLGDAWMVGVCPDDLPAVQASARAAYETGEALNREYRLRHADGTWRWILERATPRRGPDGAFAGFVGSCVDITDRKHTETERERLVHELQHALGEVKTLRGLIPVCAWCKKIRNDQGYWSRMEEFIRENSEAVVSHGVCPDCARAYFPEDTGKT